MPDIRNYIFGNSLINHGSDTYQTTVPYWLDAFAERAGNTYTVDGQFMHPRFFSPDAFNPQWGFEGVESAWLENNANSFADVDYTNVMITTANYIQYRSPTETYDGGNTSPVDATLGMIDWIIDREPSTEIDIYVSWPEMALMFSSFPPSAAEFAEYNQETIGAYADWHQEYVEALQAARPGAAINMMAVGPIMSELFTTVLSDLPPSALYVDAAPHGTETLYFLAGLVTYAYMYEESPPLDFDIPSSIHPLVRAHYAEIVASISELVNVDVPVGPDPSPLDGDDSANVITGTSADDTINAYAGDDDVQSGDGDDIIKGGVGNDTLWGQGGNDTIDGGYGADSIQGGSGNDVVNGGAGNDTINGNSGNDTISGGSGNDVIDAGDGNDIVNGGAGDDDVRGGNGRDIVRLGDGNDIFTDNQQSGSEGADRVFGEAGDDRIYGGGGDDFLSGGAGNDFIAGGAGNDRIEGGSGEDTVNGGGGADNIDGGSGADTIDSGAGDDLVRGGDGRDTVSLGAGNDRFIDTDQAGFSGSDEVFGGDGDDRLIGRGGNDVLQGGYGNDIVIGGAEDDVLSGGVGNDILRGGTGNDTMMGGDGADTMSGGDGADTVEGGNGRDTVRLGSGNDRFTDNSQSGNLGEDFVQGGDGNDTIIGGGGSDTLLGGTGNDTVSGGADHDTIAGAAGNDTLSGGGGADVIRGGVGADSVMGGAGADSLFGGRDADAFVYTSHVQSNSANGIDTIEDFQRGTDTIDLRGVDADATSSGNQSFSFIGGSAFSGAAGELRFNNGVLSGDIDGDGIADMAIRVNNVNTLTATDLELGSQPGGGGGGSGAAPAPIQDTVGGGNPSLGMGLEGLADWSSQIPFIDIMKSGRPWTGHTSGQWGAWDHGSLEEGGYLDENGWITEIPPGVNNIESFILTGLPEEEVSVGGRYRLTYDGEGTINVFGSTITNVTRGDGEIWFDFAPGSDTTAISITETDPNGNGNYIRNVSVVHEDNIPAHEAGVIFNPDWIDRIEDLRSIRFMDWMFTNGSDIETWEDRPTVGNYSYVAGGAPVEIMVALANQIGADPWFNMPHMANDDYAREFATYVRDNLDPELRAYNEYSNEVWNWGFPQTHWAREQAEARWGPDAAYDSHLQFYGMRAAEMATIWDSVFGSEADERVINVVTTQTDWPGLEEGIFYAPLYVAENPGVNQPPVMIFDAYAVTGYFGFELGGDQAGEVLQWISDSRAQAVADANSQGLTGAARNAYIEEHQYDQASAIAAEDIRTGSLAELIGQHYVYQAAVATANGLDLVMYEGGTHVVGFGANGSNQELTDFFHHFNYSMEMADLYQILLEGWRDVGGTLFNAFVDVSDPSQYGSWGALRHLDDENPRWDVLNNFNDTVAAWWETRDADAFDQGLFLNGTSGADILAGTVEEDILLGGQGNDTLIGYGGEDRLHGGTGQDTAWLIGSRSDYSFEADGDTLIATHSSGRTFLTDVETIIFDEQSEQSFSVSSFL